jgi:hypothetical protein
MKQEYTSEHTYKMNLNALKVKYYNLKFEFDISEFLQWKLNDNAEVISR